MEKEDAATRAEPSWIFGYGSLIWRPAIPFEERAVGFIRGWRRRFWQGSTDHRGVPGAPGRVVTLDPHAGARCWGVAFRLAEARRDAVLAGLDHREKGGYRRLVLPVFLRDREPVEALTWVATRDNENYLGPAPLAEIARQVRESSGPSGDNVEYVLRLAEALRALRPELTSRCDEALALAELVERLWQREEEEAR